MKGLHLRRTSVVLLGLCAAAMLIDLLPALANLAGLWLGPYFYIGWLATWGLVLNGSSLALFPLGMYLARPASPDAVMKGWPLYLGIATVVLFTGKMLAYWGVHLRGGRYLTVPLLISVVVIGACALWAWRRAKASGIPFRPVYNLLALLFGILLLEFAVYGVRNF